MNPLVTVIVPHHLDENSEYLKLCLDSILASEVDFEYEVICLSDAKTDPAYAYLNRYVKFESRIKLEIYHKGSPSLHGNAIDTASAKINWAAKRAQGKYLWIISDDVMVSKTAMQTMVEGMGDNSIICNPMSNSDNGSQFYADLGIPVKCSKEDLPLFDWPNFISKPFLIPVKHFISFYCTMIPKRLWDLVGELDAAMDCRHNDVDWNLRAKKIGIQPMINLGAFCLHFGDKTLPKSTTQEMYTAADQAFQAKYS